MEVVTRIKFRPQVGGRSGITHRRIEINNIVEELTGADGGVYLLSRPLFRRRHVARMERGGHRPTDHLDPKSMGPRHELTVSLYEFVGGYGLRTRSEEQTSDLQS